jgi:hypothetical protein
MTRAVLLNGFRLIIALAVMLSALPFLRAAHSYHEITASHTMGAYVHVGVVAGSGHGHSHNGDDLDPDYWPGQGPEHKDHSHVTLGLAAAPASLKASDSKFQREWEQCHSSSYRSFRLDRPPCPLFLARSHGSSERDHPRRTNIGLILCTDLLQAASGGCLSRACHNPPLP